MATLMLYLVSLTIRPKKKGQGLHLVPFPVPLVQNKRDDLPLSHVGFSVVFYSKDVG